MRFGHAVEKVDERIPSIGLPLMSVSQTRGVIRRSELTDAPHRAESLDAYKVCRRNDIVFNKMSIRAGAMGVVSEDGLVTYHYEVMRPRKGTDPRFIVYLMKSSWFTGELIKRERGIGAGGQGNVRTTEVPFSVLKTIDAYIPEAVEQRAIANYLDEETAQIDALVAKQEEFIALLRERRRVVVPSILSTATSSGPRPDKLHRRTRMGNGSTPRSGEDRYWIEGDIPWVNSSVVNVPEVHVPSKYVTKTAVDDCHLPTVKPGSLLVALTGQGKTRGAATILRISSTINQHLAFIEPDERYWLPEYLLWLLHSKYEHLRQISGENGATKGGLTVGDLRGLLLTMPDLDEQRRLVKELEETTARIDTLIAKAEEHISLAKERRSALITAAVTGQIDVCTARKAS